MKTNRNVKLSVLVGGTALLGTIAQASSDYGPAFWRPAYSGHWYTSGYGKRFYVIHDMEGYYWTTISYFQRSTTQASVHYCVNGRTDNGSDAAPGEITQMVRDAYYAWHAGCWNRYMYGTEHEGFASDPAWYTEAMYQASGANTKFHVEKSGIPKDRNHIIAHGQKLVPGWTSWMQSIGYSYSFATCNTHTDPGPYWDWNHYMDIVNGAPPPPSFINPPYLFNTDSQGFTAGNGISPVTWTDCCGWPGIIYNDQTGNDAFNYGPACSFTGGGDPSINVSFYPQSGNTANHDMQVFWKTDQDNTWTAGKSSPIVSYSAQNAWTTINLDVNANWPTWFNKGINQLRLDYDNNNSGTRWIVNHLLVNTSPRYWFDAGTDGWANANNVAALWETTCCGWPGVLVADQTGNDAFITRGVSGFRGAINDRIHVRVFPQGGSTVNHDMQIFFATGDENFYSAAKSTPIAYYAAKDSWIDLYFDVGSNPYWSGYTGHDITALRVDFDNINNGNVRWLIDYFILEHSGNPAANTINNASIVSTSIPSTVNAGAAISATVTMNNAGTRPWTGNHKLGSADPADNTVWGLSRVAVAGTINPGANYTFTINGTAPATVGTYSFDWQMVEEGVQWFGPKVLSTVTVISPGPNAPSSLAATAPAYNQVNLTWVDNSANETSFKVERSPNGSTYTQIGTVGANVTSYSDTTVSAGTLYYYRVKSSNSGGDSTPSNVATITTPNQPPDLAAIGGKTGTEGQLLTFTASSSNPNQSVVTTTWQDFESFTNNTPNENVMFRKPLNSSSTSAFLDTTVTNFTRVTTSMPAGHSGKVLMASWSFKTGTSNPWLRLTTANPVNVPNPTTDLDQILRFDVYSDKAMNLVSGLRETATAAAYGANGGTTGAIEWDAASGISGGAPVGTKSIPANTWTTISYNIPFESQYAFTGDGIVVSGQKGVLEHLGIVPTGGMGVYNVYLDNFAVVAQNTLTYTLDAGYPAGASIHPKTGVFKWTPSGGQAGTYNITVRVTDRLGLTDFETISVKIVATGNHPPVLAAIGNKSVNELSALNFTASGTDVDAGQTLTYSLDAGNPTGSSIGSSSGAFTWTPTEAQGPGSYPITVRVTDNGSPASNDWETITVTVNEVNTAPVLATIADQTINEGATLSATASATDADAPANSITYSLDAGSPVGMTINSGNGAISWVTSEAHGPGTYTVTVRATDNGSPALSDTKTFNVTVNEVDIAPVLTLNTTLTNTESVTDFESMSVGTYNGTVLFRQPAFSSSTSAFLDTTVTNTTSITQTFPGGDGLNKVLFAAFNVKTGQVNPWVRLTTFNTAVLPNPTVRFTQHVKFRIYSDKALGVALGLRETSTGADVGQNGGTTGALEWAGATLNGTSPNPSRVLTANTWTTLDFNLPTETITAFPSSGNGVLDSSTGKGVLEHLALTPAGGTGTYNVYVDDFQVVTVTTNLTVNTGDTITFTSSATDADFPAQTLTFSLDAGAPAGATINSATGAFTWTPDSSQGPSTNLITVRVTDSGPGALSNSKNVTIVVNKVNIAPALTGIPDQAVEIQGGSTITLTIGATDSDASQTLTFSLQGSPPVGASIVPSTGVFTWTPPNTLSTNTITIRVTDNGVPPLYDEKDMIVLVTPSNTAPTLTLGTARVTEKMVNFESITDYGNDHVMFRKPLNSSSTSAFIDTTVTNYTQVTTSFPAGNANAGAKVLKSGWTFKTGTGQWLRLTTFAPALIPNPTIDFGGRLKFDIYSDKSIKVGLGVRETGTTAAIGANGGTTGGIEWLGATKSGSTPVPSRTVNANTWTTLEFTNASEFCTNFSGGNSVLATGKGVLEHLIIVPNAGAGAYTLHLDNFEVVSTPAVSGTITMNSGSALTFTASGTDPDPGSGLTFGLDADAPTNSAIDIFTGAFSWTPSVGGTTNNITVNVNDNPTNGALVKSASQTFTVVVNADPLGPQSTGGGNQSTLTWPAVPGASYQVQYKTSADSEWINLGAPIVADSSEGSVEISEGDQSTYYRIVDLSNADQ